MLVKAVEEATLFSETFDVEPGGQTGVFKGTAEGLECEFSYVCQGGTLEEWVMNIGRESDGYYTCEVERPEGHSHSYLYFEEFQMKISGGTIKEAIIFGKDAHTPGDEQEYTVDKHIVENTDTFKNALNRVFVIVSRKKHPEL